MCKRSSILPVAVTVMLFSFPSCYEKVDAFSVLSDSEFVVRRERDTTVFIKTNGYNKINGIIINDDSYNGMSFVYPKRMYLTGIPSDTVYVEYFQKSPSVDVAPVQSVRSSFFLITDLSNGVQDEHPTYKVEIKKDRSSQIYKMTLLLNSKMDERKVVFNLK